MRANIIRSLLFVMIAAMSLLARGIPYEPPQIEGYEFPFPTISGSPLSGGSGAILKNNGKMFNDTSKIDFEGRRLTFQRVDSAGNSVWTYHYGELNEFIADGKLYSFYENWYNSLSEKQKRDLGLPAAPKLQWELAVHYPPWAQRLLGNEPPRLTITGRLEVTVAFDYVKTTIGEEEIVDIIPFEFENNYEFAIRGSVGRLISVNISHSKQDGFDLGDDPLKNFKVEYKESYPGELEDEIIQEVVIGYTGFDMPGTSLSGYSEKHDGLFGVKIRAKLGPLMLTGVASHTQGEAMTRELGGRNDPYSVGAIREDEFIKNRYFFLDRVYRDYYNKLNNTTAPDRNADRPPRITQFQAFVSLRCEETSQSTVRRYKYMVDGTEACFKMLVENQDYTVDVDRGWVRFETNIRNEDIVAITMTTADGSLNRGQWVPQSTPNDTELPENTLAVLKPRNLEEMSRNSPADTARLFDLMWRNVYYLPEMEDGKLELYYLDPTVGDTIRHVTAGGQSQLISQVLGLTDAQGRARLEVIDIFNAERQEMIIPPWNASDTGNWPFANAALGERADTLIYAMGSRTTAMTRDYTPKFNILTNGSSKRDTYDNLGWNIIPGSVKVKTKGGTELIEDEDYYLDYQMGIIELISARARSAESILITYQRESDFVLEKKVFAGLRGEMALPFISDNSFMAASILFQDAATTAGDIPSLGNEPFNKMHLSFNTSLNFQPEWMTKAVNKIPLVKTEEESAAKVDFEIVHSRMNPNTAKEKGAYLDDFEWTKDGYSISMRHQNWYTSHYPFPYDPADGVNAISHAMLVGGRVPMWDFYWFTPNTFDSRNWLNKWSVWKRDPNNPHNSSQDNYIDILRLHGTPAPADREAAGIVNRFDSSYASITTSLGRSGVNMENHRYLEIVVNSRGAVSSSGQRFGSRGKLQVQIGTFSHDQVRGGGPPNGRFDLEDPTYQNKPDQLSMYDRGLNWTDDPDVRDNGQFYMIPNAATGSATGWDTLYRGDPRLVFPRGSNNPVGDIFHRYDRDNTGNFRWANGTRTNSVFDSENIDFDGMPRVNYREKYVSYTIHLDSLSSRYIDPDARLEGDWRLYRIPLKELLDGRSVERGGQGDTTGDFWAKVRGMRLVWYDFNPENSVSEHQMWIAGIELVGNYWEPAPGSEDKIEPTSINNHDDSTYYQSVHNFIVKPKSGEATPLEQSLRLRFTGIQDGDTALVRKNMTFNQKNISGYDSLSVMVYSDQSYGDGLKFIMRFGSDDSTYYEYSAPLTNRGWNRYSFPLQALYDLKLNSDVADHLPLVTPAVGNFRIVSPKGRRPNVTAITFMALGVAGRSTVTEGEIWVNEMIATGPRVLTGIATRVNLSTQWADFLSLGMGASYTDGGFRTMTESLLAEDNSELSANIDAKVMVNKFMPEEWGVVLPVGGSVSGSLLRPTVKPQSDIMLNDDDGNPDGLFDMAGDAFDMFFNRESGGEQTRAERFQTFTTTRNAYTSFEKTSESENPFVNFTLDRVTTDLGYNMTASYTGKGPHEHPDSADYFRSDTTTTYTGNLRYDLSPRNPPEWTTIEPFDEAEWVPKIYQSYAFNLLPSTIKFDLVEAMHRTEKRNDAKLNIHDFTTRTFDLRHGVQLDYTPIDPLLNFGYGLRWDRDVSDLLLTKDWDIMSDSTLPNIFGLNRTHGQKWDDYYILYGERSRTQTASMSITPQFVTWMTHNIDYSADYTGQLVRMDRDSTQYMNANVATALRIRTSLLVTELFKKLAGDSKEGFFPALSTGVSSIAMRSINFEFDANTDLKNSYLSSMFLADTAGLTNYEYFKYQLGLRRSFSDYFWGRLGEDGMGWMFYRQQMGVDPDLYRHDQAMGSWSTRFSTAFVIPVPIKINITNASIGWGREFYSQPDSTYIDTTIVLPEIRAAANTDALELIPIVRAHMAKLGLSSSFSYKRSRQETKDRTDTTVTIDFQPLIGLDGKHKALPTLTGSYRFGTSNTMITSGARGGDNDGELLSMEENERYSHTFNVAYEFSAAGKLEEIRIWRWAVPVQGKANVGMTVNWEKTTRTYTITGDDEPVVTEDTQFDYSPYMEYKFTDNVRGQARYLGSHKNQSGMKTMQQRFAITVEVVF